LTDQQSRDLQQDLRMQILADPARGIGSYRGEGPLGAWVHVCAVRAALAIKRASDNRVDTVKALDDLVARDANPELLVAKTQHRDAFRAALAECFAALSAREKTLLKMHFIDEMSIDEMGVLLRVHRATVARWLVAIRHRVLEQVCAKVMLRIEASASEMRSLIRLVRSDVSLSLDRVLVGREVADGDGRG
jgi:RNA polymerase sigma-70 factor (ECF subfamily)